MKEIFFLKESVKKNTPKEIRLKSFRSYIRGKGVSIVEVNNSIYFFLLNFFASKYIFISMPEFKYIYLFFMPRVKIILDIRDGWSIAQTTGYGGTVKIKPFKAYVTRIIEKFLIRRSFFTIACTNGLQEYLEKVSGRKVYLIPNGVLDEDFNLAQKLKINKKERLENELVFCCAGQFSEYGIDKVKKLCLTIIKRYPDKRLKIQLIGSNKSKNLWLNRFLSERSNDRVYLEILPRKNREELYKIMANADYGIAILRDPSYEFGTKVYDYISLGLPVINYFDKPNNFTNYFDACLDFSFGKDAVIPEIRRSELIKNALDEVEFK